MPQHSVPCAGPRLKIISATAILELRQESILESCTCFFRPTSSLSYWPIFGTEPANEMRISLSKAIWQGRCPRCREGYIFKYPLRQFTRFSDMNQSCDKCEVSFEPEPGFYFGSLYVSYAFTIAIFAAVSAILYYTINPPEWVYITSVIASAVLFIPVSFRYSRILFLYWFGGLQTKED